MMTMIIPLTTLFFSTWLAPTKYLWPTVTAQSLTVAAISTYWLCTQEYTLHADHYLAVDEISAPLMALTCWITAPTLLASQHKLITEPVIRQRMYITIIMTLQTSTVLAFLADDLLLFFVMFETTMIPTLMIITRWGTHTERLLAGVYFLFYTMIGSMALLATFLLFAIKQGTMSYSLIKLIQMQLPPSPYTTIWWFMCVLAFLIKAPLFGLHLWLPKAHVEAPIAGSMILAGTLLKLGGYGIFRTNTLIDTAAENTTPLIILSLLGVLMSAALSSRQTDLKALIAFSSISHMGLAIAALLINTKWSMPGALMLMISHGLVSSTMFCLANAAYDRTNTRTLILLQGSQIIFPLLATWWLLATLLNMSFPPSINFLSELFIISSLFQWSNFTILIAGLAMIFTTIYSLYMFWTTQRNRLNPHSKALQQIQPREHILLTLHIIPALLLILNPNLLL